MADFSKIGRNNKNRGRNFERRVAEKLGFSRVPYSGAIKEWGGADVVDGFYQRRGYWAIECKTQQPGPVRSISIKHKWVKQMIGAEQGDRHGVIITAIVGNLKPGMKQDVWVFMMGDVFFWMKDQIPEPIRVDYLQQWRYRPTYTRGKGFNFVVKSEDLPPRNKVTYLDVEDTPFYVMHLDDFAEVVRDFKIFVPEVKPDAQG